MFRNYFQVAVRNFMRHRWYSVVNVVGLTAGLLSALMIFFWVNDEWQKDKFHNEGDRVYIALANLLKLNDGNVITWENTPGPLSEIITKNLTDVELAVRTTDKGNLLFHAGENSFFERGFFVDPDFFNVFSYPIISGTRQLPANTKNWVALSEKVAIKLFGSAAASMGQVVTVENNSYNVITVFEDTKTNSSLQFDFLLPYEVYKQKEGDHFALGQFEHPTYIKLKEKSDVASVQESIKKIFDASIDSKDRGMVEFYLQPFRDRYLHGNFENGRPSGGRILYVQLFSIVAVFILVIACINFMNMATARALMRAKEVGVRKSVGAERSSLIQQFVYESVSICALAMLIAIAIAFLLLPLFNMMTGKHIDQFFLTGRFIVFAILITLISGILAGSYPAFVLSSFKPSSVLKGSISTISKGQDLRRVLVVFQFAITVILIISAIVVYRQGEFIRNKDLGYNRVEVVTFSLPVQMRGSREVMMQQVSGLPGVLAVSGSNQYLMDITQQSNSPVWPGKPDDVHPQFRTLSVDYDFVELMKLKVIDGRSFSKNFNDSLNFLITRKSADIMDLKNPVGQSLSMWGLQGTIVGVLEDFHSRSLYESIDPVILICMPEAANLIYVRMDANRANEVLSSIQSIYKKIDPEFPVKLTFLNEEFERMYGEDKVVSALSLAFTVIAVLISALGLLGLTAYTTERKRKEISIRKTLGATVPHLVGKMTIEFIQLSGVAIIIGCITGYYAMNLFLTGYAYRTTLSWDIFIVTALLTLLITIVVVTYQVVKASVANPVEVLRSE